MGTFTLALKEVIDLKPENVSRETFIGLGEYPIFDQANNGTSAYRTLLNAKIIDHYWNQEMGVESVPMFQLAIKRRMNEIMPLYNQLYLSERKTYDPLVTMDIHTVMEGTSGQSSVTNSESSSDTASNAKSRAVQSDTPQTILSGSEDYATSAADSTSESDGTSTGTETATGESNATEDRDSHTTGYQGSPGDLLNAWRAAMLNIDMMVIADLSDCFMGIWGTNDEILPPGYNPSYGGFYMRGYYL